MGTIRSVTRHVKRWRDAGIALRWVAARMIEANKGFRPLKAHKQFAILSAALQAHHDRMTITPVAHVTRPFPHRGLTCFNSDRDITADRPSVLCVFSRAGRRRLCPELDTRRGYPIDTA